MGKKTARGRGHQGGRKPPKGARRFKGGRVAPRAEQLHFPDDVQADDDGHADATEAGEV